MRARSPGSTFRAVKATAHSRPLRRHHNLRSGARRARPQRHPRLQHQQCKLSHWLLQQCGSTPTWIRSRSIRLHDYVSCAGCGFSNFQGANATSINDAGAITGNYIDFGGHTQGFVRNPGGEFTEFGAPGTNATTLPAGINDAGAIAGSYTSTSAGLSHGFLRSPSGVVT